MIRTTMTSLTRRTFVADDGLRDHHSTRPTGTVLASTYSRTFPRASERQLLLACAVERRVCL